jgi:hypothetical protein
MRSLHFALLTLASLSITLIFTGVYMVTIERTTDLETSRHYVGLGAIGLVYISWVLRIMNKRGIK